VKLYGLVLLGPEDSAPKKIKLFVNQPVIINIELYNLITGKSITFSDADDTPYKQELVLKPSTDMNPIPVDLPKFQNISHLTVTPILNMELIQ
jgi:hypothetical protein